MRVGTPLITRVRVVEIRAVPTAEEFLDREPAMNWRGVVLAFGLWLLLCGALGIIGEIVVRRAGIFR